MTRPTVLVLGGGGMLGHKLAHVLGAEPSLAVHATVRGTPDPRFSAPGVAYHEGVDAGPGSTSLRRVLAELAPDVVVNAVGAIKQKDLKSHLDETFHVNGTLPHLLPLLNPNPAGKVVHFSTDCVFRGDRGAYRQDEAPDVEDVYGRSKALGEIGYGRHLTLRTSIIGFETGGHLGLLSWFFSQPRGSRLRGFSHAVYSGLPTVTLARTVRDLLLHRPETAGLWHVASEPVTKLDLLRRVNEAFGLGHEIAPDDALRMDRSLDDAPFRAATGTARPDWDTLVAELRDDFRTLPYAELYAARAGS